MSINNVQITHLFHSGFMVETKGHLLVFDYFDPRSRMSVDDTCILNSEFFAGRSNVYVFSTHSHGDHFDPHILEWEKNNHGITYIFSDDIKIKCDLFKGKYFSLAKDTELIVDDINIKTYGSTDLGISFLVRVDDVTIFHAGDLNWWHWINNTKKVQLKEERDFKNEVEKIKGEIIDIAFFPVDPNLGEYYYLGGGYFAKTIKPKLLVPMHFANHYDICQRFADKIKDFNVKVPLITPKNKSFIYKKDFK